MSFWTWFRISFTFSKCFLIHFFLFLPYFYFFYKNYYHFTKGKEPAQSPKPAVSFPLNPFLLGHGLGCYPKNPTTSEIEVSSVSYEQICVAIFFFQKVFDSFLLSHHVILNSFQDLTFIFSKWFLILFFLISSLFLFFYKNYYHFTKGKEPARSPKPAVSFPLNPFLLGHGLGCYPKNPPTSEKKIEVSSVSYEQIRENH